MMEETIDQRSEGMMLSRLSCETSQTQEAVVDEEQRTALLMKWAEQRCLAIELALEEQAGRPLLIQKERALRP
jgi:hypothetical protein